jgi:hypothetical protein
MGRITGAMMMSMGLSSDGRRRGRGSGFGRAPDSEESSTSEEPPVSTDIGTLSMEGDHEWKSILHIEGIVRALQISPDGKWMAYHSMDPEEGSRVFVVPFPDVDSGSQYQVPASNPRDCFWSPQDGRELFYYNIEGFSRSLMAIEVETEPTFNFGTSNPIFNLGDMGILNLGVMLQSGINVDPNGKRFLTSKPVETADDESRVEESTASQPNKIIVVTNWFEELKERIPVD